MRQPPVTAERTPGRAFRLPGITSHQMEDGGLMSDPASATKNGSSGQAGPTTGAGPLGKVDPVSPTVPGTVLRPPLGTATLTLVVGLGVLIASLVVLGS